MLLSAISTVDPHGNITNSKAIKYMHLKLEDQINYVKSSTIVHTLSGVSKYNSKCFPPIHLIIDNMRRCNFPCLLKGIMDWNVIAVERPSISEKMLSNLITPRRCQDLMLSSISLEQIINYWSKYVNKRQLQVVDQQLYFSNFLMLWYAIQLFHTFAVKCVRSSRKSGWESCEGLIEKLPYLICQCSWETTISNCSQRLSNRTRVGASPHLLTINKKILKRSVGQFVFWFIDSNIIFK